MPSRVWIIDRLHHFYLTDDTRYASTVVRSAEDNESCYSATYKIPVMNTASTASFMRRANCKAQSIGIGNISIMQSVTRLK